MEVVQTQSFLEPRYSSALHTAFVVFIGAGDPAFLWLGQRYPITQSANYPWIHALLGIIVVPTIKTAGLLLSGATLSALHVLPPAHAFNGIYKVVWRYERAQALKRSLTYRFVTIFFGGRTKMPIVARSDIGRSTSHFPVAFVAGPPPQPVTVNGRTAVVYELP